MELRSQLPSTHLLTAPVHPPERVTGPPELHHSEGRYPGLLALVQLMIKARRWLRDGDPESISQNPSLPLLVLTAGIGLCTDLIGFDSGTYLLMSLMLVG